MQLVIWYMLPGILVLSMAVRALLRDDETPNSDPEFWVIAILASLIWPITLPNMLRKKFLNLRAKSQQKSFQEKLQLLLSSNWD